jgi:hypothetical protein
MNVISLLSWIPLTPPSPLIWGRGRGEGEHGNVKRINALALERERIVLEKIDPWPVRLALMAARVGTC